MSVQVVGADAFGTRGERRQPLAARIVASTISIIAGLTHRIIEEVVYTIREDLSHGRISRDPKDWECD